MSGALPFDDELLKEHLALATSSLPGPDYYTVLRWMHEILKPRSYIEIGIRNGESLLLALAETRCIGIDPLPGIRSPLPENMRIFATTSDEFFRNENVPALLGSPHFSVAFIDGLHLFEQALRDFINLEKFASPRSIILLHDCLPLDAVTSDRTRTTHFYTGDVWKLTMCLRVHRPDLRMTMIRTRPTGLCLVSHLNPQSTALESQYADLLSEFVDLSYADFQSRRADMPGSMGNTREEVAACLTEMLAP
jgi:hypothetical protein